MSRYYHSLRVRQILSRIASVVCPPDMASLNIVDDILDDVELSMDAMAPMACKGLVAGTLAFDAAARVVPRHFGRRFVQLSDPMAADYFRSWWRSRIGVQREWARGVKGLLCMAYYEMPPVKAQLGFTPEQWIQKVKTRRLAVFSDVIEAHQRRITEPDPLPLSSPAKAEREAG